MAEKSAKKTEAKAEVKKAPVAPAPKPAPKVVASIEWSDQGFASPEAYEKYKNKDDHNRPLLKGGSILVCLYSWCFWPSPVLPFPRSPQRPLKVEGPRCPTR